MTGVAVVPMIYLDTNGLLSLKEFQERAFGTIGTDYRKRGRRYEALLRLCIKRGYRVSTLSFTLLEMLDKYQRWNYYEKKVKDRALYDEIFGGSYKR